MRTLFLTLDSAHHHTVGGIRGRSERWPARRDERRTRIVTLWCFRLWKLGGGEVAGAPEIPAGDRAPGRPLLRAALHVGGPGEQIGRDLDAGLEALEGEGEAFADAVVAGGENVRAAEAEDEHHLDGPLADAPDLREVLDDGRILHPTDLRQGRDGAVESPGGEVAEGEGLVVGEAGGAELLGGAVEEVLG